MTHRRITAAAVALCTSTVTIVATATPAGAYEHLCGKYSGSDPDITYAKYSLGSAWSAAFDQGQYAWDTVAGLPTTFIPAASGADDPMLEVRDGSYAETWWAQTSYACWHLGPDWNGNETAQKYNTATTSSLSATNKKYVAIHELGHSLGLDHVAMDGSCEPRRAVMSQGSNKFGCSGTPPWQDDQNGVTDKY